MIDFVVFTVERKFAFFLPKLETQECFWRERGSPRAARRSLPPAREHEYII